jgi:hypothetical protein
MSTKEDARDWDVRLVDRRLRRGQLSRKDLDKHQKALPDVTDKSQPVDLSAARDDDDFDDGANGAA